VKALLDVNVLIAMHDAGHSHHQRARDWLADNIDSGWASCAITQNGFIRILSQPRYPLEISTTQAIELLQRTCSTVHHTFWPADISLIDPETITSSRVLASKQVTDLYLLALAARQGGRLVTFDANITQSAVVHAGPDHLVVI